MKPEPQEPSSEIDDLPETVVARPGSSVRGQLAWFALALILPVLLFAGYVLWQLATSERDRLENEAGEIAQQVVVALDRELTGIFAALEVLSTSAFLQRGDLEGFYRQGAELLQRQGIVTVLTDLTGQQLVNVRLPQDAPLPRSALRFDGEALAGGRVFVTDLVVGQVTGTKQVLAVMGVRRGGTLAYVLYFSIALDRLQRILRDADIAPAYKVSIVDRQGTILARSALPEEFVGRNTNEDLRPDAEGRRGTWSGRTADGTAVFGAFARSRLSDFRAAAAIAYSDLNAPLWRSISLLAALGTAVAALSVALAFLFGRRITAPLAALAGQARRLGEGEPVAPLSTGLNEANQVGAVLAHASTNLREREEELRDANEEMQRFAYIVSHDLRSPLVNIMGFTTELEALRQDVFARLADLRDAAATAAASKDDELGRDFDEAIGFIKASIAKMDRLINAILRLSREGRREFHPARVDMDALVAGIKASLTVQAEAADATVTATRLPPLVSDRLALEQIFTNLVDNALKYLRRGVPGRVEIVGRPDGPVLVYEVRDNGRGIDSKDTERVFDLFRRSGVQDRPGEGIGLAHVRALVRRLGGTISLTSTPGQGSSFTVTLPRRWAGERQRKAA